MNMVQSTSISAPPPVQSVASAPATRARAGQVGDLRTAHDTVNISENARQLAQSATPMPPLATPSLPAPSPATEEVASVPPPDTMETSVAPANTEELQWGPDLTAGWNDSAYLKMVGDGYTGSLSFTTKNGTKIGVAAAPSGEDGKPSSELLLTAQTADGTVYERTMGDFLCITEDEKGLTFAETNRGKDGADNIIFTTKKDSYIVGGNASDTLISLTSAGIGGGGGDDTMVSLGTVDTKNKISASSGDHTVYARQYAGRGDYSLNIGYENNSITIDHASAGSEIYIHSIGQSRHENTTLNIGRANGTLYLRDGDVTVNINDFRGVINNGDKGAGREGYAGKTNLNISKANGGTIWSDDGNIEFNISSADSINIVTMDTKYSGRLGSIKNSDIMFSEGSTGALKVDSAEWSLIYGKGISIDKLKNSIVTESRDVYATARVFGIARAKQLFENWDISTK